MSAIRDQIMKMAANDPSVAQAAKVMEAKLASAPIEPGEIEEVIKVLEFVLQHPDQYPTIRAAAIRDGFIDESLVPEQFDPALIVSILIALYMIQERVAQQPQMPPQQPPQQPMAMAHGGLARLAAAGRGGDSMLAYTTAREREMLERVGGAGTVNPNTGLREYKGGFFKALTSVIVPVATILLPGIGTAIGSALTGGVLGAAGSSIVGGAALGALGSAASGGNVLQGAVLGGLGGGLGGTVGNAANSTLGLGLDKTGQAILGSGLVGAATGAITGKGVLKGALTGAAGGALGQLAGTVGTDTALGAGLNTAGITAGNMLTAGYDPKTAVLGGGLAGIAGGLSFKPSDAAVGQLGYGIGDGTEALANIPDTGLKTDFYKPTWQDVGLGDTELGMTGSSFTSPVTGETKYTPYSEAPSAAAAPAKSNTLSKLATVALMSNALGGQATPEQQQAVSSLSPSQQEYFNRPSLVWDWDKLQSDAASAGMDLGTFMAKNWNNITAGQYNVATAAKGGALSQIARYAKGSGTGRTDSINARLSDGEYVMDAETVAMLGDGSNEAGARALDRMREEIRKQKGKALAKGKISPDAKSPLTYLKGVA